MDQEKVETTLYSLKVAAPQPSDRRTSERHLSLLRVGSLVVEDRHELCLIRNISAGGMMIRAYCDLPLGMPVSIELRQGEPIRGVVRWVENELTGVSFDQAVDVLGLLQLTTDGQRPRMPRIELDCNAWIREGEQVQRVRVLNVSQGGVCIEAHRPLTLDADVVVTMIGLVPVAAVVKWVERTCFGIGFNRKLPLRDLVGWLREQQEKQLKSA